MQASMLSFFNRKKNSGKMEEEKSSEDQDKPWIEKYRPNTIDEITFQDEAVAAFKGILETGEMPHLLLYGPPGTGKTSIILALAKQLFGADFVSKRVLELNASDDRGIGQVREKVKTYASQITVKCPNFKIIILDEADNMTNDAQTALRRIIEDYSKQTRFCIICNYITKIIEPLSSRCIKFRFKPIPENRQREKLEEICKFEGIKHNKAALEKLVELSDGDLRRSTNLLQTISKVHKTLNSVQQVEEISGVADRSIIESLVAVLANITVEELIDHIDKLINMGYSAAQILDQYFNVVLESKQINAIKKSLIMEKISSVEACLIQGSRDDLQLYDLFVTSKEIMAS